MQRRVSLDLRNDGSFPAMAQTLEGKTAPGYLQAVSMLSRPVGEITKAGSISGARGRPRVGKPFPKPETKRHH